MKIIFFTHPPYSISSSMPRYAKMLGEGMRVRGANIDYWTVVPLFFNLPLPKIVKKWMGYIDQYIIFPIIVRFRLRKCEKDTLFVFTDHALGPWIPLVKNRKHIVHCHDFLAQKSAMGLIPENPVSKSGKRYQQLIYNGYVQGKNFISVSTQTKQDLHDFLPFVPTISEVVYNAINKRFVPLATLEARKKLGILTNLSLENGFILHVGGNQWYKNRIGVIHLYEAWRLQSQLTLPLLMIGKKPNESLLSTYLSSQFKEDIHFLEDISDEYVHIAYAGASVFLFPSLAEGFGWPIAEAMASGCMVVTTNADPMKEVAGEAGFLIQPMPNIVAEQADWAMNSAKVIEDILSMSDEELQRRKQKNQINVTRFNQEVLLDKIYAIYKRINR